MENICKCLKTYIPSKACNIKFKNLDINDKGWVLPFLQEENNPTTYGCFGSLYLWGQPFNQTVAKIGSRLLIEYKMQDELYFAFPPGSGSLHPAVCAMKEKASALGMPLIIKDITEEQKEKLQKEFPDYFEFTLNENKFDYFYEAEKLASLSGKKLHGKRNHCNRFVEENENWHFEVLKREHFKDCMAIFNYWEENHKENSIFDLKAELNAIELAFKNFEELGMEGGALFIGNKLVAFTLGEMTYKDSFDVHFEKAMADINGAYSMINREFVRSLLERHESLKYINREEDLGLENLRKAKESYYPAFMAKKYIAIHK